MVELLSKSARALKHPRRALSRLRWEALRMLRRDRLVQVRIKGSSCRLYVDLDDPGISRELWLHGEREVEATRLFGSYLEPGQTVIDVGANIGYYVLIEAERVSPTGRIYAIEPGPSNVEILKKNVASNGYTDIVDVDLAAISDASGTATLHLSTRSNLHTLVRTPDMDRYSTFRGTTEVPTFRLDDYLAHKGIEPRDVDVVRMDIEGHEANALDGMTRLLSEAGDLLMFIELHPWLIREGKGDKTYMRMLELLERHGFEIAACAPKLSSDVDRASALRCVSDLLSFDEAIGVFLRRHA